MTVTAPQSTTAIGTELSIRRLVASFDTCRRAETARRVLVAAGFPAAALSVTAGSVTAGSVTAGPHRALGPADARLRPTVLAWWGGGWGALLGLLSGFAITFPASLAGVVVAAGAGALIGTVMGSLAGRLLQHRGPARPGGQGATVFLYVVGDEAARGLAQRLLLTSGR